MEMFKYLYHGDNYELLSSGYVVTEYFIEGQYIMIIQESKGEIVDIAHTNFKEYE